MKILHKQILKNWLYYFWLFVAYIASVSVISWTAVNYKALTILSGLLLVIIGLAGIFIDLIPNL